MTHQLTLKPIIKDMLERAGIEDVYDFAPSARECACPIVIANESYERTDLLDDCEYGIVKLEIIAVRETRDEALTAISKVIYALHKTDWERWNADGLLIRNLNMTKMPKRTEFDSSGYECVFIELSIDVTITTE